MANRSQSLRTDAGACWSAAAGSQVTCSAGGLTGGRGSPARTGGLMLWEFIKWALEPVTCKRMVTDGLGT
jgi:hypothetical protein